MFRVEYDAVERYWDKCGPMLQKAIDEQDMWTLEAVYRKLITPSEYDSCPMQLWYCPNKFALVTQVQVGATGMRKLLLFLCGGSDLEAIKESQSMISEWAKKYHGCKKLSIHGRRGWVKALGFDEKETIMEHDLWAQ